MQSVKSRSGSSEMPPKNSSSNPTSKRTPSPNLSRSSSVSSSASADSRTSRIFERKSYQRPQSPQQKQRPVRAPEVQQQWGQLQEDLKRARKELAELEKLNEESTQSKERINMLESEVEKAKESETKMLESLFSQTKQLEQTKILLEEAKLEVRNLEANNGLLTYIHAQEEIKNLRTELRLAMEAEEKSKKAMDDFAIALKEVTSELSVTKSELAIARATNSLFTEHKLKDVLEDYHKLKLRYEESAKAWKEEEERFIDCIKISEEEMKKKDQEHRLAREEISKLRNIIKQAVNEAMLVKDSLEIARHENYELHQQLSKKENALQQAMQDYDSLRVTEASAVDSMRERKDLLASSSAVDPESVKKSKAPNDDRNITRNTKKYPSDRWIGMNPRVQNGHRHSVGESDTTFGSVSYVNDITLPSPLSSDGSRPSNIGFYHLDGMLFSDADEDKKKKKTALQRFGDVLRRRSFGKSSKN